MSINQRISLAKLRAWNASQPMIAVGKLKVPAAPEIDSLIYRNPDWKTDLIGRVLARRDGVFVDVGVNIGQTLIDYADTRRDGGYVGFEPNPRCASIATSIIKTNNIHDAVIIPTGLSDSGTVVPFFVNPALSSDSCATLIREIRPEDPVETVFVPVYRFDDVHRDVMNQRDLALIKIDVEGGELQVLLGMKLTLTIAKPWIICEVLHRDIHADAKTHAKRCGALMTHLKEFSYQAYRIKKSDDTRWFVGLQPVDYFPEVIYDSENKNNCDYLFAPADDVVSLI